MHLPQYFLYTPARVFRLQGLVAYGTYERRNLRSALFLRVVYWHLVALGPLGCWDLMVDHEAVAHLLTTFAPLAADAVNTRQQFKPKTDIPRRSPG